MTKEEKRKQVGDQCRVVAHLATALAQVSSDFAKMFAEGVPAMDDIADQVGARTARQMEDIGDMLNGMDAVESDDDWVNPIFEKAHELWPQKPGV